jgi:hypothetical protein
MALSYILENSKESIFSIKNTVTGGVGQVVTHLFS